jgi:hypothetical protein
MSVFNVVSPKCGRGVCVKCIVEPVKPPLAAAALGRCDEKLPPRAIVHPQPNPLARMTDPVIWLTGVDPNADTAGKSVLS